MMSVEKATTAPRRQPVRRQKVRTDWRAALNFALLLGNVYTWYDNLEPWILIGSLAFVLAVVLSTESQRSSVFRAILIAMLAIGFIL